MQMVTVTVENEDVIGDTYRGLVDTGHVIVRDGNGKGFIATHIGDGLGEMELGVLMGCPVATLDLRDPQWENSVDVDPTLVQDAWYRVLP